MCQVYKYPNKGLLRLQLHGGMGPSFRHGLDSRMPKDYALGDAESVLANVLGYGAFRLWCDGLTANCEHR